jgi:serine/threonine protein kinase
MEFRGKRFTFETKAALASGGMAQVYLAAPREQPDLNVAVKIPLAGLPPVVGDLFLREADAAQRVSSPHVVEVVDWGDAPPFIAFEYMDAITLTEELRRRGGSATFWSLGELLELYAQLVVGMKAINEEVIHRDLKPDNMFLADVIKISDFGIAKYVGEVTRSKTFKGWGTPEYMAPESFRLDSVEWQADQYSLGVVFYELASLQRPFSGTWDNLEQQHLYQRPTRLTAAVPALPERLATMVARMIEKRPPDRFASWEEVQEEIDLLKQGVLDSDQEPNADEPLVRAAAGQLEARRSEMLEQQRSREEHESKVRDREALLSYWADELLGQLAERVERINA